MKIVDKLIQPMCQCKAKKIVQHCKNYVKGRVLDVGAGRCLIAKELQEKCSVKVDCVDVSDLNETDLKLVVYDGKKLPYKDNSFDTLLIVYVLHHCKDPVSVLKECRSVCKNKGRIIIFEDFGPVAYTHAIDWLANKFLHDVEAPLNFKKHEEWMKIFEDLKFNLIYSEGGVEKQVFYPFIEHKMFVLEVKK